jgi:hypothetical protein
MVAFSTLDFIPYRPVVETSIPRIEGWHAIHRFGCIEMVGRIKKTGKSRSCFQYDSLLLWTSRSRINLAIVSAREFATSVNVMLGLDAVRRTVTNSKQSIHITHGRQAARASVSLWPARDR